MWEGFFQDPGRTLQSWEFFNFPFLAVTPGALSDGNMQVNQWMVALPNKMIERNKGTVNGVTWLEYGSNYKACSALARSPCSFQTTHLRHQTHERSHLGHPSHSQTHS
nr:uncharacterized protein LOC129529136 isoform X1 [Gorilla gorilla gorilla]